MKNNLNMVRSLLFGVIFAEAVALGAFIELHTEREERDRGILETVALEAPSAVTEPCEAVVEPVETIDSVTVESFTAETPFYEIETVVDCLDEDEGTLYFDVPLEEDLQDHIFALCEERGIDPAIVIAMIDKESKFDIDIIGDRGKSYGLMQIQPRWHKERMENLGVTDLLDPYQNVTVGIDILGELLDDGRSIEEALMIYNGGYSHASGHMEKGTLSDYATYVLELASELERK